ncbi:MAG TPA: hypothetical protein VE732_04335, partial [Nitrososphaera sp.]|nr:hypothetical protein [Nitrososphaera sp.]
VFEHGFNTPEAASRNDCGLLAFCGSERCVNNRVWDCDSNSVGRIASHRGHNEKDCKNPQKRRRHTRYLSKDMSFIAYINNGSIVDSFPDNNPSGLAQEGRPCWFHIKFLSSPNHNRDITECS